MSNVNTFSILPKKGVDALAYTSDAAFSLSCVLCIKLSTASTNRAKSASISLRFPISHTHGFEGQTLTIFCDAENLISASLCASTTASPDQVAKIHRNPHDPQPYTLSLVLKGPCPVSAPSTTPDGFDYAFHPIQDFAYSQRIHVLFDYSWVHQRHHSVFDELVTNPASFTAFSLNRGKQLKQSDIPLVENAVAPPPPYVEASSKRSRPASLNSECPCPKRDRISTPDRPCSPTEKATTVLDVLSPKPPCSPFTNASDFQQIVNNAVEAMLPAMMLKTLEGVLQPPASSQSSSSFPAPPSPSSKFVPDPKSALLTLLNKQFANRVEALITKLFDRATDRVEETHRCYKGDYEDWTAEERDNFRCDIEDMKIDLNDKFAEFHDKIAEVIEQLDEQANIIYAEAVERMNDVYKCAKMQPDQLDRAIESKRLLKNGIDINTQGGHYGTALQAASFQGTKSLVELLLREGADVNAQGGYFGNALQSASFGGHTDIVRLLLDAGADANAQGGHYGNALQAASAGGHERVVRLLLGMDEDVESEGSRS